MKKTLLFDPAVFAVGTTYQILARVGSDCTFSVEIDGVRFHDHFNGVLRTQTRVHRATVPQAALDRAGKYAVIVRPVLERRAYRSCLLPEERFEFAFRPLPAGECNLFQIADTHGRAQHAIRSAEQCGAAIDLLVLNGDVIDAADKSGDFDTIFRLAQGVTHGSLPVICTRGNHDLRGKAAERMGDFIPTENGRTYYTLRLGDLWALVLDTGEDKPDDHPEYGGVNCCHAFREEQTAFLRQVIANAATEYAAPDVRQKLVIVHNPFTHLDHAPFDIEPELFREWTGLLREYVRPHLILTGHYHDCFVSTPGDAFDTFGQPCPVVVGAKPERESGFTGCLIRLGSGDPAVRFCRG
ncbi:MAG: metallophosphoesterase [Clostridia bacterium]|nr:metallophosphoesterase [Clostridia bacterium]